MYASANMGLPRRPRRSPISAAASLSKDAKEDIIFVGIDFGTTYSGVAWAYSRAPESIEIVASWETDLSHCADEEQVPTQLELGNDNEPVTWGFGIPNETEAIKWFKLLLLEDKDVPEHVSMSSHFRETRASLKNHKKDATALVASYLESIWNHSVESIKRSIGAKQMSICKFSIVITIPAIWPPYAQQKMKNAVWKSGMMGARPAGATTLQFISEPEAAALATIQDLSKMSTIKVGDTMVVCDAGGGTVDLISYAVESIEPFTVKECVKGDGALCGGVCLDERFVELIKSKITPAQWKKVSIENWKKFLNDTWEHRIKSQFRSTSGNWAIELPEGCNMKVEPNSRKRTRSTELTSGEILSVFKPSVTQIEKLVRAQADDIIHKLQRKPTYIVLVGGFGRSTYLFERLRTVAESYGAYTLQSRGNKPWTAICRGAVIQGLTVHKLAPNLNVEVKERIARSSYGVDVSELFDPEKHDERDKFWDEKRQQWLAKNQVIWFLKQGEILTNHKSVSHNLGYIFDAAPGALCEEVLVSNAQTPPLRKTDDSVSRLCSVKWEHMIQLGTLPKWVNPLGKVLRTLDFSIEMKFDSGIIEFTISHNGMQVGERSLQVEFDYL